MEIFVTTKILYGTENQIFLPSAVCISCVEELH